MKATMLKLLRGTETLRTYGLDELVRMMREGEFQKEVNAFREIQPYITLQRREDGSYQGSDDLKRVPRLCFSTEMGNRQGQRIRRAYNGLVLLEVDNLKSMEEAVAVRQGATLLPQTLLAFVGVDRRSVKIVCRGELLPKDDMVFNKDNRDNKDNLNSSVEERLLPEGRKNTGQLFTELGEEDLQRFHVNLYEKARLAYDMQLGVTFEKLEPTLDRTCYFNNDADAYYNPLALPFYTDCQPLDGQIGAIRQTTLEPSSLNVRWERYDSFHRLYEFNLAKALDDMNTDNDESDDWQHLLLTRLASYCQETGIPMGTAIHLARSSHYFWNDLLLVDQVFANAYRLVNERRYRERKNIANPLKNIPQETLLTMKIDMFLQENYELRKNVMRGVAEYRERKGIGFSFRDLTEEARNSITMRAIEQGIKCWDKDIRRYVNSNDIELYDPIYDFLEHLPRWDGHDRVTPLARRIQTSHEDWPHLFHIWMRSMVAMWQGRGQLTGNALVPVLMGRQGCGKSSFCRILLPREQREYYNDRINFKNEADLNLGLTSFALINLDEFDKITQRQQIVLKYLVSTSDLKYRPPYGKAYTAHRRYASFIGTTNILTPLTDPTGSRRFVCVEVEGNIDFETPIEYDQLYAQLKQELADGECYWLTKEEEQALTAHNLVYQQLNGLGEMFLALYRRPNNDEEGQWLSLKAITDRMKQHFGSAFKEDASTLEKLGAFMNRPDQKFQSRRRSSGMTYWVVEI